jgi:hypothetical protein
MNRWIIPLASAQSLPQTDARSVRVACPFRIEELVEDPAFQPLAVSQVAEGRAGGLAMVGQDVGVVPVVWHAPHDGPRLFDRSTSCRTCKARSLRGPYRCANSSYPR